MVHHTLKGCPHITDAEYMAKMKSRCTVTESGCWEWQGFRQPPGGMQHRGPRYGYGEMSFRGKQTRTHRIAWVITHGAIPAGMLVMHKCDNPPCCNPDHLKLGTSLDNQRDMSAKGRAAGQWKTHCKRGHPLSGDNLRMKPHFNGSMLRYCMACQKLRNRRDWQSYKARQLAAANG
jgi:hypothetical protein